MDSNKIIDLERLIGEARIDYDKFFTKHNKTAGIRLRKKLQEIRSLSKAIRDDVQALNRLKSELSESIK
ncbi:MAG: hypothetical protein Kapaf2KO_11350 [Candidatus Kapaibacteriales bacterium]